MSGNKALTRRLVGDSMVPALLGILMGETSCPSNSSCWLGWSLGDDVGDEMLLCGVIGKETSCGGVEWMGL